jgi:hypothetical protein
MLGFPVIDWILTGILIAVSYHFLNSLWSKPKPINSKVIEIRDYTPKVPYLPNTRNSANTTESAIKRYTYAQNARSLTSQIQQDSTGLGHSL